MVELRTTCRLRASCLHSGAFDPQVRGDVRQGYVPDASAPQGSVNHLEISASLCTIWSSLGKRRKDEPEIPVEIRLPSLLATNEMDETDEKWEDGDAALPMGLVEGERKGHHHVPTPSSSDSSHCSSPSTSRDKLATPKDYGDSQPDAQRWATCPLNEDQLVCGAGGAKR